MSRGAPEQRELQIELAEPNELFEFGKTSVADGIPPSEPGIDRIRSELGSGSIRGPVRLSILLPREHVTPATERGMREALATYCETGLRRAENDLKALHRDGWQTLLLGALVLVGGLAASDAVITSKWPSVFRVFFGDGLFLVVAWVGLWYPLDTLIYAGRPYRAERRLLRAIRGAEIAVLAADECVGELAPSTLGSPEQSLQQ